MILLAAALSAPFAFAQDDDDWGDGGDDAGFADADAGEVVAASAWSFSGYLRTQEALWVERLQPTEAGEATDSGGAVAAAQPAEPLAMARQSTELALGFSQGDIKALATFHGEVDPYYLLTENYDDATARVYGWQAWPGDTYVSYSAGPVEVTAGRQTIAWGEGLIISPVDRVAARDTRDLGMADPGDLRLPATMLKVAGFFGSHRVEALVVPEADFGLCSPPKGPYGLVPGLLERAKEQNQVPIFLLEDVDAIVAGIDMQWVDNQPRFALDQVQAFGRWTWRGRGVDLGLYAGTLLDKQGVIGRPEGDPDLLTTDTLDIPLDHARYTFFGHSGAAVLGKFVLRWELAADRDRQFNWGEAMIVSTGTGALLQPAVVKEDLYTGMAGVTWTGVSNLRVDLEYSQGWMPDDAAEDLTFPVGKPQFAARIAYSLLRERLELATLAGAMGSSFEHGLIANLTADYELADGLHAGLGYVTYRPGEELGPILGMDSHDRLFAQARWDF